MSIIIRVTGIPAGQPRPRASRFGKHSKVYNPKRKPNGDIHPVVEWKHAIREAAKDHAPETPWDGPVGVGCVFRFPRPKSHYGTGRNAGKLKPSAPLYHCGKPDYDNVVKTVLDVLTELGFWHDDGQAQGEDTPKMYVQPGEQPGVTITLTRLHPTLWADLEDSL